ncbi:hypothetical protein Tsubulata_004473 [Turnera subulata]|uniref:REF/SRPP-like protein n=1 Tax=Turnera subulata TaxID=218843 RepID=A0A9Q0JRJ4_9ROSI|nr:hypothetical protein Tsubulata_004473 [Turnera subulata]
MGVDNNNKNSRELKHLGLVRLAAINAVVCVSNLYGYAKRNSGPLGSAVGTVENAVTAVVGPVYEKFKGVPDDLLVFLDKKVDEATHKFDKHAPPLAKRLASQAHYVFEEASKKAQELVKEARTGGPRAVVHYAATESKKLVLDQSVKLWVKLDRYPSAHKVADVAVPVAANWSEKYNRFVVDMTRKGFAGFGYLPLVPVEDIAKAFKQGKAAKKNEGAATTKKKKKEEANGKKSDSDSSDSD